jgi:hypothetical protein
MSVHFFFTALLFLFAVLVAGPVTILGWIAVSQIRRSAGRLHGLWLAVADGLLFPLLALDLLIGGFWFLVLRAFSFNFDRAHVRLDDSIWLAICVSLALLTSAVVNWFVVRRVWRAVKTQADSPDSAGTSSQNKIMAGTALSLTAISGILGTAALWMRHSPPLLDAAILMTALAGIALGIAAWRQRLGKSAIVAGCLNVIFWFFVSAVCAAEERKKLREPGISHQAPVPSIAAAKEKAARQPEEATQPEEGVKPPATNGVSIDVRIDRPVWKFKEAPVLRATIKNGSEMILEMSCKDSHLQQIELDGTWYRSRENWYESSTRTQVLMGEGGELTAIAPGAEWRDIEIPLVGTQWQKANKKDLDLSAYWSGGIVLLRDDLRVPLMPLRPGKHIVRVGFLAIPARAEYQARPFKAVSQPIEFEILPPGAE